MIILSIAAAKALIDIDGLTAEDIAVKSMKIAADICVYTNHNTIIEIISNKKKDDTNNNKLLEPTTQEKK